MSTPIASAVLSVDVEEWFNLLEIDSVPEIAMWDLLEDRVEQSFHTIMRLCDRHGVHMTCFFLGWVAEHYPDLVREASDRGHEIASHGYAHELVYRMGRAKFAADIRRSKAFLKNVAGVRVLGYRAPGFSCIERTPWFFNELAEAGFVYDSSIFPAHHGHGGLPGAPIAPHAVKTSSGTLAEFPVSTVNIVGQRLCMFGGGYLRLFPEKLIRRMGKRVLSEGRPLVLYLHPREVDPDHPRLAMGWMRRFKSYVGLVHMAQKLKSLLSAFSYSRFCDLLPLVFAGDADTSANGHQ